MRNGKAARKILIYLLAFVIIFGSNVLSAFAEDGVVPEDVSVDSAEQTGAAVGDGQTGATEGDEQIGESVNPILGTQIAAPAETGDEELGTVDPQAKLDMSWYNADDVAAGVALIDHFGITNLPKDDQEKWEFAIWNTDTKPFRLEVLTLAFRNLPGVLDVSAFTALKYLDCVENQFTEIRFGSSNSLVSVLCNNNLLTSLDVSGLTNLEVFNCSFNQLTSIDVSNLVSLERFYCENNQLTSLNISNLPALRQVHCQQNMLTSIDATNASALEELGCPQNQLTTLDFSKTPELQNLACYENKLTQLNVSNNSKLNRLTCENNQLTSLDVSNLGALATLGCSNNLLTTLDVSALRSIETINCANNQIKELDFTGLTTLVTAQNENNPITKLTNVVGNVFNLVQPKNGAIQWGGYVRGNDTIFLICNANEGYSFRNWSGLPANAQVYENTTRFGFNQDLTVSANVAEMSPITASAYGVEAAVSPETGDSDSFRAYMILFVSAAGAAGTGLMVLRRRKQAK